MSETLPIEQAVWPYTPRNVDTVEQDAAVIAEHLQSERQSPLSEQDKQVVDAFALDLMRITSSQDAETTLSVEALSKTQVTKYQDEFYIGYFAQPTAQDALQAVADTVDPYEAVSTLYDVEALQHLPEAERKKHEKTRSELATQSNQWFATELTKAVVNDTAEAPFDVVRINTRPELVIEKLQGIRQFRRHYRELYVGLKDQADSPLTDAKRALLTVYMSRVNAMAALTYPAAIALMEQLGHMPDSPQVQQWQSELTEVAPFIGRAFARPHEDRLAHAERGVVDADQQAYLDGWKDNVLSRLDYIRNGASIDDEGRIARVGTTVLRAIDTYAAAELSAPEPTLPAEVIAHMEQTKWDEKQMKAFNEAVLAKMGLLSEHSAEWDDIKTRKGRAPDGKIQVVLRDDITSLIYEGRQGALCVPRTFNRSLIGDAGALPLTAHEISHVIQDEIGRTAYKNLPLAAIGGARNITTKEMGGIREEAEFFAYAGKKRPPKATYPKGVIAKDAAIRHGKAPGQAIVATAKAIVAETLPSRKPLFEDVRKKASLAMRLIRHGGHNSQPLDYIEQAVQSDALKSLPAEKQRVVALATGALSLRDTARLVRAGVITIPTEIDYDPAKTTLGVYLEQFYPDNAHAVH